jgi:flagellar motor switch protein FliN/FliY
MSDQETLDAPSQPQPTEAVMPETTTTEPKNGEWASALSEPGAIDAAATPVFQKLAPGGTVDAKNDIDLILNIPVQLTVELGRTKITIKNLLQLAQGSVVELDGVAGEPMDVLVNGCLIAQGEVVVVNEKFGIRLTDIVTPSERMRQLNR